MIKQWNAIEILARAEELKIQIEAVDGNLKIRAAKGTVTPKVLSVIKAHKAILLDYFVALEREAQERWQAESQEPELCSVCMNAGLDTPATGEPDDEGYMYCAAHRPEPINVEEKACRSGAFPSEQESDPCEHPVVQKLTRLFNARSREAMAPEEAFTQRANYHMERRTSMTVPGNLGALEAEVLRRLDGHGVKLAAEPCLCGCRVIWPQFGRLACARCKPGATWSNRSLELLSALADTFPI